MVLSIEEYHLILCKIILIIGGVGWVGGFVPDKVGSYLEGCIETETNFSRLFFEGIEECVWWVEVCPLSYKWNVKYTLCRGFLRWV